MTDQPNPVANDQPIVQAMVREDLHRREQLGIQRYGTPLQPFNGRDALTDAYEEALDLACYLRQALAERDPSAATSAMSMADATLACAHLMVGYAQSSSTLSDHEASLPVRLECVETITNDDGTARLMRGELTAGGGRHLGEVLCTPHEYRSLHAALAALAALAACDDVERLQVEADIAQAVETDFQHAVARLTRERDEAGAQLNRLLHRLLALVPDDYEAPVDPLPADGSPPPLVAGDEIAVAWVEHLQTEYDRALMVVNAARAFCNFGAHATGETYGALFTAVHAYNTDERQA